MAYAGETERSAATRLVCSILGNVDTRLAVEESVGRDERGARLCDCCRSPSVWFGSVAPGKQAAAFLPLHNTTSEQERHRLRQGIAGVTALLCSACHAAYTDMALAEHRVRRGASNSPVLGPLVAPGAAGPDDAAVGKRLRVVEAAHGEAVNVIANEALKQPDDYYRKRIMEEPRVACALRGVGDVRIRFEVEAKAQPAMSRWEFQEWTKHVNASLLAAARVCVEAVDTARRRCPYCGDFSGPQCPTCVDPQPLPVSAPPP